MRNIKVKVIPQYQVKKKKFHRCYEDGCLGPSNLGFKRLLCQTLAYILSCFSVSSVHSNDSVFISTWS